MNHKYRALLGASMLAIVGSDALAQTAEVGGPEEVLVTGTRIVMTDGSTSPTPLTVVSTEQLQATTPTVCWSSRKKSRPRLPRRQPP